MAASPDDPDMQVQGKEIRSLQNRLKPYLPQDSETWLKYGQKIVTRTGHQRFYYKCAFYRKSGCPAKRIIDFPIETPSNLKIFHRHTHVHPNSDMAEGPKVVPDSKIQNKVESTDVCPPLLDCMGQEMYSEGISSTLEFDNIMTWIGQAVGTSSWCELSCMFENQGGMKGRQSFQVHDENLDQHRKKTRILFPGERDLESVEESSMLAPLPPNKPSVEYIMTPVGTFYTGLKRE